MRRALFSDNMFTSSHGHNNGSASTELEHTTKCVRASRGWTPSNETWEPTTSHRTKQSIWLRTVLCGGWCLRGATIASGACQKEDWH